MKNNYSIHYRPSGSVTVSYFETQAKSLEDAIIAMYEEFGENVEYITHEVEYATDYDNETISQAIAQRQNR